MSEPVFVGAGKKAGKELWRIESLKPVRQPTVSVLTFPCRAKNSLTFFFIDSGQWQVPCWRLLHSPCYHSNQEWWIYLGNPFLDW